ncbi:MAG TPA: phosphate ABC transporter permease subunit PstC [Ignavibacteriaceae bacterium]|nr:phosphate ABC transporter permease subunit PstC [Ignavibacteriaceae bacterium]
MKLTDKNKNEEEIEFYSKSSDSRYGKKIKKFTRTKESLIKFFFAVNGVMALVFIILIFIFLFKEGFKALEHVGLLDFLYTTRPAADGTTETVFQWYPTSDEPRYSLIPLILGTLLTAIPATIISTIFGVAAGVYLSEVANPKWKEFLKPLIELFAGIPTVVIGFIMLVIGASFFNDLLHPDNRLNAFIASIGLSFVIIPVIASLTEDALHSIPNELRMASYGLGATKWQTISRVILPAAFSGVSASIILGFGRAIGETMIVLMAAGNAANITSNLFLSVRTMTATIAAEMGEVSQGSDHYYSLFFIGIVLFAITFILNLIAEIIINKMRKKNTF